MRDIAQSKYVPLHNIFELNINIDGVPLFKSTNIQCWPILCSFGKYNPFVVAIFCRSNKTLPVSGFLEDFIQEVQNLRDYGIVHEGTEYQVHLSSLICDAPARYFLKCITSHNGYYCCERCVIRGTWNGRVVLTSQIEFPARSKTEFDSCTYEVHQVGISPLIDLDIDCINQFTLDYMHLVCLGVMKRILHFLIREPNTCRLSVREKAEILRKLQGIQGLLPSVFARRLGH